ncbi:MAG: polysaccharide pyruvyl transferase family protein [Lachnospiraceae bacterium]
MRNEFEDNYELWGASLALEERESGKNPLFQIYRKMAILLTAGISISDILLGMNICKVKVYGYGELGRLFLENIQYKIDVCAVYDVKAKNIAKDCPYRLESPDNIHNDGIPIIITPGKFSRKIAYELIQNGIERKSLITLNTILTYGMEKLKHGDNYRFTDFNEKQFLITGAQFHNIGAQAMLFTAVSEIRKRFPNATVWYLPVDDLQFYTQKIQKKYKLLFLTDGKDLRAQLYEILPGLTAIIDVSGYALSSKWDCDWYIRILRMAYNYQLPLYLMPQSYGPLEFDEKTNNELKILLSHATKIYAREKKGYDLLTKKYDLTNVEMSTDLVLQNKELVSAHIYDDNQEKEDYKLETDNNVGIIPNIRNYEFGNKKEVLYLYKLLIEYLLNKKKEIYIIAHSDDISACDDIYAMFYQESKVHLCTDYMDCVEYCQLVKNFQYLIASRFHAIVYAYKENIPCMILGWAQKYKELAFQFGQDRYVYDVRENIDIEQFLLGVDEMNCRWREEKMKLEEGLLTVQSKNCFDFLDDM